MKKLSLILIIYCFNLSIIGQHLQFTRVDSIDVQVQGNILKAAWAGGINAAQFSTIDLNHDNNEDLFIFDRTGNKILTYINNGNEYEYQPSYENSFPDLEYWALLRDFDLDGKKDIFSYVSGGIGVWKNNSSPSLNAFDKVTSPYVFSYQFGNMSNLYVSKVDIPDINDIDDDGDLDVLTFGVIGSRLEYHQNFSVENGFNSDSLNFEMKNACWGHFRETGFNTNTCILFDTCSSNVSNPHKSSLTRHAGSTVLSLDLNNDNVKDVVLGDVSFGNLVALENDNTGINMNTSFISQDTTFPSNTVPVDLFLFPGSFYEDINLDGVKDLIVSPNTDNESENKESVWYYQNFGTNSNPSFNLISKNQFQSEMIETGKSAFPVLFDYNNDGLLDLFISNFGRFDLSANDNYISSIMLFENTGTNSSPSFNLITEDFQNLSSLNIEKGLYPCFGDLDNDNDIDMIIGDHAGYLHYFMNTSSDPGVMNLILLDPQIENHDGDVIDVGYAAKPTLIDIDNDNDLDLVIGEENGNLNYYENIGSSNSYLFRFQLDDFGGVDVSEWWTNIGNSIPCFYRNQQNELQLFVGSEQGAIFHYNNIENNLSGNFNLIDTLVGNINIGPNAAPSIGYINNDTLPDLILGNERGGVSFFYGNNDTLTSTNQFLQNNLINVFPNPSIDNINIEINTDFKFKIYDSYGRIVKIGTNEKNIDIQDLSNGWYILKIETNFTNFNYQIIKLSKT